MNQYEKEMITYEEKLKKHEIELKKYLEQKKQNQIDIEKTEFALFMEKIKANFKLTYIVDPADEKYKKKHVHSKKCSSIFFDGRTIHRGLENGSDKMRYAIYISYYKKTYIDYETQLDKKFDEKDLLSVCNQSYKE